MENSKIFIIDLLFTVKNDKTIEDSNSNWTFIVLNLPIQEDSKVQQNKKAVDQILISRDRRGSSTAENTRG